MNIHRREFLKIAALALTSAATARASYEYGSRVEATWPLVEQVQVPLKNLPTALDGYKIVQLSDIHLHPFTQIEFVQEIVALVNNLKPNLVVLTGDYVLQQADSIFELAPVLARLKADAGVFVSLGNHDWWTNVAVVKQGFSEVGLMVLQNKGVTLGTGRARLYLAGLDDGWSGHPDLKVTLADAPAQIPIIMLMHEPDFADTLANDGRISLQLSGHTHGGQVRLPGVGALILPHLGRKYASGLYRVKEMWLYTNRGIGVVGPPVRFNCRPEITELILMGL